MNEEAKNNSDDNNFRYQTVSNPSNQPNNSIDQNINDNSINNINIFDNNPTNRINTFRLNENKKNFFIFLSIILSIDLFFYFNYKFTRFNYTNYNIFTYIDPMILCKQYYDIFNECVYNETYLIKQKEKFNDTDSDSSDFDSSDSSDEPIVIDPNVCKKEGNNFINCNENSLSFMKYYQPYISKYRRCKKEKKKCSLILNDIKYYIKDYKYINSTIFIDNL